MARPQKYISDRVLNQSAALVAFDGNEHECQKAVRQLVELVTDLTQLVADTEHSREVKRKVLYVVLAAAYALGVVAERKNSRIRNYIRDLDRVSLKRGAESFTTYVRICLPGKKRNDWYRYTKALKRAYEEKLSPEMLFKRLSNTRGGIKGYAFEASDEK